MFGFWFCFVTIFESEIMRTGRIPEITLLTQCKVIIVDTFHALHDQMHIATLPELN